MSGCGNPGPVALAVFLVASTGCSVDPNPSGASSGTTDAGVVPPRACGPGVAPYEGPLCGPPDRPCTVYADEIVSYPLERILPNAPSIAVSSTCMPEILYSAGTSTSYGYQATREAWDWVITEIWSNHNAASLVIAPDDTAFALTEDARLWSRSQGKWMPGEFIPNTGVGGARSLALDSAGKLHAALGKATYNVVWDIVHATYSGGWTAAPIDATAVAEFPLAVSSNDRPHLFYRTVGEWQELQWVSPPGAPEVLDTLIDLKPPGWAYDWNVVIPALSDNLGLAISAPDSANPSGRPHVLYAHRTGSSQVSQLFYATRNWSGIWDTALIDQTSILEACDKNVGMTCSYDFEVIRPLGIIATPSGNVRFFYEKLHRMGVGEINCGGYNCVYVQKEDHSKGAVYVAWIDLDQVPGNALLVDDFNAEMATMLLDATGRVHLAAYQIEPNEKSTVRYLQLGP